MKKLFFILCLFCVFFIGDNLRERALPFGQLIEIGGKMYLVKDIDKCVVITWYGTGADTKVFLKEYK